MRGRGSTKSPSNNDSDDDLACRAYEVLSDQAKREAYDQQMGFGRASQFHDYHFAGSGARGKPVYSDDEYENMNPTDRRTKPFGSRKEGQE